MAANTANNANKASVFSRFAAFSPIPSLAAFVRRGGFAAIDFFNSPTDTSSIGSSV